jgi:hypothetical protein
VHLVGFVIKKSTSVFACSSSSHSYRSHCQQYGTCVRHRSVSCYVRGVAAYRRVASSFLGELAKLRKATIGFVMSVRPSAWNNSAPTRRIFTKFDIRIFFRKLVQKIQVSLKFNKNDGFCTCSPVYIYDNISLNSCQNKKHFS